MVTFLSVFNLLTVSVAWSVLSDVMKPGQMKRLFALVQHQSGKMGGEPWHLYQTTLFAMYVDYDNGKVRLSAALACHDADLEMSLKDFVEILSREAVKEAAPLHYTPGSSGKCIHRYRNPYFKRRRRDREPDIGFYS